MYYSLINSRSFVPKESSKNDYYIIDCSLNCDKSQLAVNLWNELIEILDSKTLQTITTIKDLENMNHMIKYSTQNMNHIIVSTFDSINVYDLRHKSSKVSKTFKINPTPEMSTNCLQLDPNQIHMTCFDFNNDNNYLVSGTELSEDNNVYIFFWDTRKSAQILGVYYESHRNDMTDIRFHPKNRNIFATGSCDELINIFDINQREEDEALLTTLNVENAVEKINWSQTNDKNLFCITQEESIQLWDYEEVVPKLSFSAHSNDSKFDYVIDVLPKDDLICVGDKSGSVMLLDINHINYNDKNEIQFKSYLTKGHNKMVRTVCSASDDSIVYSGGEDGMLCLWNESFDLNNSVVNKNHIKTKIKMKRNDSKNRLNPY